MEKKRVVLVTGASSGIGEATALLLANNGYTVYGAARRVEKMKHLELAGIRILPMDISDDDSIVLAINEIIAKEGAIDILINNWMFRRYVTLCSVAKLTTYLLAKKCSLCFSGINKDNYLPISI